MIDTSHTSTLTVLRQRSAGQDGFTLILSARRDDS